MSAAAEALVDRITHRRIALGRYSNHVVRLVLAILRRMEVDLVQRIQVAEPDGYGANRLDRMLGELRTVMDSGYSILKQRVTGEIDGLAVQEAAFTAKSVASAGAHITLSDLPTEAQIVAAVKARPFQGVLLREALDDLSDNAAKRVRNAVRQGFIEGQSPAQIARGLRGTKAAGYKDGVLQMSRRGAEMLVRTAVTHTSNVAATETYRSMGDLVTGVIWSSILDGRTTLICIGLNGRHFPVGGKHPPAHWGCRSTLVPDIKGVEAAPIPSYEDWLKRQTPERQDDVLGPARAKLWRSGAVALGGFIDRKGQVLTLAQLSHH